MHLGNFGTDFALFDPQKQRIGMGSVTTIVAGHFVTQAVSVHLEGENIEIPELACKMGNWNELLARNLANTAADRALATEADLHERRPAGHRISDGPMEDGRSGPESDSSDAEILARKRTLEGSVLACEENSLSDLESGLSLHHLPYKQCLGAARPVRTLPRLHWPGLARDPIDCLPRMAERFWRGSSKLCQGACPR